MSGSRQSRVRDLWTGALALALGGAYVAQARGIEDSLLADAVGASGVPVAVGSLLAACGLALLLKAGWPRRAAAPGNAGDGPPTDAGGAAPWRPHAAAAGLLLILVVYVLIQPWLGYIVSVGLLTLAAAWFGGARDRRALAGCLLLSGPLLWLLFDVLLRVRLPAGAWRAWLGA
ncbi:MAG: hypothetical protein FGM55_12740 [Rhodoferax sp.]|nr:hypothetical protein [Rhodoferax sp.]